MKKIELHILPSLIIESAKNETYLKGRADKSTIQNSEALSFNEQMGDDTFHERKAQASLLVGLESVKTLLSDYILPQGYTVSDNSISSTLNQNNDTLDIILYVSDRFNESYTDSLARNISKYITDYVIEDWYKAFNINQAQVYTQMLARDTQDIYRCFNKLPPKAPVIPYPKTITPSSSSVSIEKGHSVIISYVIDTDAIDDVVSTSGSPIVEVVREPNVGFKIYAVRVGAVDIKLFSYHDNDISAKITINVTENE